MVRDSGGHGSSPKLTDEIAERICQAVRTGATIEGAAAYAGVARQTFFDWLRRGRQPNARNPYKKLAADLEEALGVVEVANIGRIAKAGQDEWTANAWILERRFPDKYGRRTRVDGQIQVQAMPTLDVSKLTQEELQTLRALLVKAAPAQEELAADQRPALELLPGGEALNA